MLERKIYREERHDMMKKGSITVEAALALPVFLFAVVSVVFLMKIVYTHELIQHAIAETADELAASGYIFRISGLEDLDDSLDGGMEKRAEMFEDHISTVFESFSSLDGLLGKASDGGLQEIVDAAASNPVDELKSVACFLAAGAYGDLKTELFTPACEALYKEIPDFGKRAGG